MPAPPAASTKIEAAAAPAPGAPGPGPGAGPAPDDEDDGKLAADLEYRRMAMNMAAREQREYCDK